MASIKSSNQQSADGLDQIELAGGVERGGGTSSRSARWEMSSAPEYVSM